MSLVSKLMEIREEGIIKNFYRNHENWEFEIEFYKDLPPEQALIKLDCYLYEKYGLEFFKG